MVAKHAFGDNQIGLSYLLAKIHMVAKHADDALAESDSYLLAKIHMVAKLTLNMMQSA